MKKLLAVAVLALALSVNACGGSSNGDTGNGGGTTTGEGAAASKVVAGAVTGASSAGTPDTMAQVIDNNRQNIIGVIVSNIESTMTGKFKSGKSLGKIANEPIVIEETLTSGEGTIAISGEYNVSVEGESVTITGDVDVTITNWLAEADDTDGNTYSVTLNGGWNMQLNGTFSVTENGESSVTIAYNITVTQQTLEGQAITFAGEVTAGPDTGETFSGSVDVNAFTVTVANNYTLIAGQDIQIPNEAVTCTGSLVVSIEGEADTQTCNINSDCSDCVLE